MTEIVVHGTRLSPFVEKVCRVLAWKGLPYELADIGNPMQLAKLNPVTRKMPVAFFDGERVYDSTFIARRADELQPEPPLWSPDPTAAAAQRLLEDWADESLYWYAMALRFDDRNRDASIAQILSGVPAPLRVVARPMVRRNITGMVRAQGLGRLPRDVVIAELGRHLDDLVTLLGTRPFFHADRPSGADFAVHGELCMLTSGPTPEAEALLAERPGLADWRKRVEEAGGV
jgi:glutathione S-transferase